MSEIAGRVNVVYVSTSTAAITNVTGVQINGVDNSSLNRLADLLDISQFGDTYRHRLTGLKDLNSSLSGNFDPSDVGQLMLEPADFVYIGFYPHGSDSSSGATQVAMAVENFERSATADGKQTFSCALQGAGEPVALPAQTT